MYRRKEKGGKEKFMTLCHAHERTLQKGRKSLNFYVKFNFFFVKFVIIRMRVKKKEKSH